MEPGQDGPEELRAAPGAAGHRGWARAQGGSEAEMRRARVQRGGREEWRVPGADPGGLRAEQAGVRRREDAEGRGAGCVRGQR